MCGRYASFREDRQLADEFDIEVVGDEVAALGPSWNVAPTSPVRIVVARPAAGGTVRHLRVARWGLVPSWAADPSIGTRLINARAETLSESRAFAPAFAARRALLPADGYFEWQRLPGRRPAKQPYYLHAADDVPLALAGMYEFWRDRTKPDDDPTRWLVTAVIVTRPAADEFAHIHDRQPLMLTPDLWSAWLDPAVRADGAAPLLQAGGPALVATPVSDAVNAVRNNGPRLIAPAGPAPQ
ncbi:MAG: SOS response-associated peptidase [Micrococcales bacterium]|nr:SOS response-associated peptidase [Micrococcales bacterium]